MAQTIIVKGRIFSMEDTLANEIERTCQSLGVEIRLDEQQPAAAAGEAPRPARPPRGKAQP